MQKLDPTISLDRIIRFGEHSYPFYVRDSSEAWPELLTHLAALEADHFVLVTDASFPAALREEAVRWLAQLSSCTVLTFAGGERTKTLSIVEALAQAALEAGVSRRSCVVALGGGLAGNVAGLLAALLFRGIRLVHVPTTLLAMSDSVLSLKQAVNSPVGKNHLGTFYTPELVWCDLTYLRWLPAREIQSALCELIKNVVAISPEHYNELLSLLDPAGVYTPEQYLHFIELCIAAKCSVMHDDPQEKRGGLVLEYGHTVGHALEWLAARMLPQGTLPHGFAVGLGMLVEARISRLLGLLSVQDEQAHVELLRCNGAPTALPQGISVGAVLVALERDNKRGYLPAEHGLYPMVLLEQLGRPHCHEDSILTPVPANLVTTALKALR
jgi:3-dehydroquinate synthetase